MTWFSQLPPSEQITIVVLLVSSIFNCGVFWATVRFLSKRVAKTEERLDKHDEKFEDHTKEIAELHATAGGRG